MFLEKFDADILVIQECENPYFSRSQIYKDFAKNYLWIGGNKNKGLGVFAKDSIKLEMLNWSNTFEEHQVKYFLPVLINGKQQLLAVWAHYNNSPTFGYIGQLWKYIQINRTNFSDTIFMVLHQS